MNRLEELERRVIENHRALEACETSARQKRVEIGSDLREAKKLLAHGRWLPWLKLVGIPERTARDYMAEAKSAKRKVILADLPRDLARKPNPKKVAAAATVAALNRAKGAASREKIRAALIAAPSKTNRQVLADAGAGVVATVASERKTLVEQGLIPDMGRSRGPLRWSLPDRKLINTCEMFSHFVAYAGEMLERMPKSCERALLNPATEQEKNLHWGLLQDLGNIQMLTKQLQEKFTQKPRAVAGTDFRKA